MASLARVESRRPTFESSKGWAARGSRRWRIRGAGPQARSRLRCEALRTRRTAALLENADVDAVLVCTPPNTHPEIVMQAIERGLHVMCEKPLAIDVGSASAMVKAAEEAGVVFTMAAKFRFVDDVIRARQIVGSGILGELMVFENAFASRVDMSRRWNADPAISGGGVLIDNGTHSVDIVRYFLGPIAEVMAVEGKRVQHLPVEDTASMLLRTPEGVLGTVDLSWSVDRVTDTYLTLYGSEGTVSVGWKGARVPAGVESGVGHVRRRLRQARVHGRAGRELLRGDPGRRATGGHRGRRDRVCGRDRGGVRRTRAQRLDHRACSSWRRRGRG